MDIEACAYNLEHGKIVTSKLDKKFIFEEKLSDNVYQVKFAIPNVKVGTVIEYKIKKTSPFYYSIPDWYFQRTTIPVKYSRFHIIIPEYFIYHINIKGYEQVIKEEKQVNENIHLNHQGDYTRIPYTARDLTYTGENIPAMRDDDHVWNVRDYMTCATFELAGTNFPGEPTKSYSFTWEDIDKTLQSSTDFVRSFTRKTSINDDIKQFDNITDEKSKIEAIYNFVKGKVRWNGEYAFYDNAKDALKNGVGNNVQINGLLISALNDAGIMSYPVLLRSRSQGRLLPVAIPSLDQLTTYIVAAQTKDGTVYYLDGSATRGGLNMLPTDLLVDRARTFNLKENGTWVDLTKLTKNMVAINNNAEVTSDGKLECKIAVLHKNQLAYEFKNALADLKDSTEYIEKFQTDNNVEVINYSIKGHKDNLSNAVKEAMLIKKDVSSGNFIYINPMIIPHITKNPFIQSERKLPIEFEYPSTFQITTNLKIPDGYTVEELPKSGKYTLHQNAAGFDYLIGEKDNYIQLSYKFYMDDILYSFTSYPDMKDFFGQLAAKNSEMIVLKKK
ncbi:MAG: hypothetical protein PHX91_06645 [Prevotella sp.]|nr:hypothetical protein [Prevotella sp.]